MRKLFSRMIGSMAGRWASGRVKELHMGDPQKTLKDLLFSAKDTRYGKQYGFESILQAKDPYLAFCQQVPLIDYSDWVAWLGEDGTKEEMGPCPLTHVAWPGTIDMYCLSSGTTTGRTKYIPYSKQMAAVNRKAAFDFFATYLHKEPGVAPLLSRTLYLSGSTNLNRSATGVISGDMSGLTKYLAPKVLDWLVLPSRAVSSLEPWDRRLEALIDVCRNKRDIGVISGIPIWQLTLLEALEAETGTKIPDLLPNLRFVIHGGMSIAPYRDKLSALVGGKVQFLEVYAASEAGISAFQLPGESGMRFFQNYGVFYEFENDAGEILLSHQIQPQKSYRLIISNCSGLWRYRIGDCLVFSKTDPLTLSHVSRDKTTSAFDEKVTEREVEDAMVAGESPVADFSMGPDVENRHHIWFLVGSRPRSEDWLAALDSRLRESNQDYDDYRGDGRIKHPKQIAVEDRAAFLKLLGREEGGQRKFPRLLSPDEVAKARAVFMQGN